MSNAHRVVSLPGVVQLALECGEQPYKTEMFPVSDVHTLSVKQYGNKEVSPVRPSFVPHVGSVRLLARLDRAHPSFSSTAVPVEGATRKTHAGLIPNTTASSSSTNADPEIRLLSRASRTTRRSI